MTGISKKKRLVIFCLNQGNEKKPSHPLQNISIKIYAGIPCYEIYPQAILQLEDQVLLKDKIKEI